MSIFNTGKNLIKKVKPIPIFLTVNNEYMPYAACSITSIIKHADPKRYYRIIILHDGISWRNYFKIRRLVTKNCEIQFKRISHSIYLRTIIHYCSKHTGSGDFFSSAVYYYRAFIARLFPQYNKAIYIDSDTILLDDIATLYDYDLKGKALAAMIDPKVKDVPEFREYVKNAVGVPCDEYVNSGVMVMDTKKLRKLHYLSRMINMINEYDADLVAPDQDYLNVICYGEITPLDPVWNTTPTDDELPDNTKLVHYNLFKKPWLYDDVDGEEYFWEAAKKSGFYLDLQNKKKNFTLKEQKANEEKIAALIGKAKKLSEVKEPLIKKVEL